MSNPTDRLFHERAVHNAALVGKETPTDGRVDVLQTSVAGVTMHNLHTVKDLRGCLSVGEFGRDVPFMVSRYFLVFDVPSNGVRGEHAHFRCHQFLVAVKGTVHVTADDGRTKEEFVLDRANKGLHFPPLIWGVQYRFSSDAVLLVLASDYYNDEDYVRSYEEFLAIVTEDVDLPGA